MIVKKVKGRLHNNELFAKKKKIKFLKNLPPPPKRTAPKFVKNLSATTKIKIYMECKRVCLENLKSLDVYKFKFSWHNLLYSIQSS